MEYLMLREEKGQKMTKKKDRKRVIKEFFQLQKKTKNLYRKISVLLQLIFTKPQHLKSLLINMDQITNQKEPDHQ